jgi:hypothetical protein
MSERDWNDAGPEAARYAGDNARRWTPPPKEEEPQKANGNFDLVCVGSVNRQRLTGCGRTV